MEDIKDLMSEFHQILVEFNTNFIKDRGTPLFQDLEKLEHCINNNIEFNENTIFYDVNPIKIILPDNLGHTIPNDIDQIEVSISVRNITIQKLEMEIKDPIIQWGGFDIVLEGIKNGVPEVIASWHLDKREQSDNYSFIEPEYHFSFGGKKMEEKLVIGWDFKDTLLMRTPRLMHPPMGIVLGIDFILNNYIDKDYCGDLLEKRQYQKIITRMKDLLWRPYALAFAKNFFQTWEETEGLTYDDGFCNAILGT